MIGLLLMCAAYADDGDEISRSRGRPDEILVLYPRVVPATDDAAIHALARRAQDRLGRIAASLPSAPVVSQRPFPERTCPAQGCRGLSVGLLLAHEAGGCAGVVLVTPRGPSAARLVPWVGRTRPVVLASPWRVAPESEVIIEEFVLCEAAWDAVSDEAVRKALAEAVAATATAPTTPAR